MLQLMHKYYRLRFAPSNRVLNRMIVLPLKHLTVPPAFLLLAGIGRGRERVFTNRRRPAKSLPPYSIEKSLCNHSERLNRSARGVGGVICCGRRNRGGDVRNGTG